MYRRCFLLVIENVTGGQNAILEYWVSSKGTLLRPVNYCKGISRRHFRTSAVTGKERDHQTSSQDLNTAKAATEDEEQKASGAKKDNLLSLLGGMKVELSTKKRFQSLNMQKAKEQKNSTFESLDSASSMFQTAAADIAFSRNDSLSPELVAAASAVASSMPENVKKQTESELLQQLRKHEAESLEQKSGEGSRISALIADMKVGKHPGARAAGRAANQIRFDDDGRGYVPERGVVGELDGIRRRKGLYGGKRLNVFPLTEAGTATAPQTESVPSLWDVEFASAVAASVQHPPRNGFEEMIQWTKEGKLWHYPIDNEAGLEEEKNVEFYEHIFLEKHLEDFPKSGPIRHFMELVVVGLSKNPCLTVQQKLGHIEWFRNYFHEKEDILKECNVYLS